MHYDWRSTGIPIQYCSLNVFFPSVGLVNKGDIDPAAIQRFYLFTSAMNVIAFALIAYGILMHA